MEKTQNCCNEWVTQTNETHNSTETCVISSKKKNQHIHDKVLLRNCGFVVFDVHVIQNLRCRILWMRGYDIGSQIFLDVRICEIISVLCENQITYK